MKSLRHTICKVYGMLDAIFGLRCSPCIDNRTLSSAYVPNTVEHISIELKWH
jgi:hypothetical protein